MMFSAAKGLRLVAIGSRQTDFSRGVGGDSEIPFKVAALAFPIAFDAT